MDKNLLATNGKTLSGLSSSNFADTINGLPINLYTLKNSNGLEACFTNYGQRLVSLMVPDQQGVFEDVVLGFESLQGYQVNKGYYFGSIIGRYGNRIANGNFVLEGQQYALAKNNGKNHLHGGELGFESVVWEVDQPSANSIRFHRISPHMEEGYPGTLEVQVSYELTDADELKIRYTATTDRTTHVNLTHHSYFNLRGAGNGTIEEHTIQLNALQYTPVDEGLIPTGELAKVVSTPFDFTVPKPIGSDIDDPYPQLQRAKGYDHNFVLNSEPVNEEGLHFAARVKDSYSGRMLEVYTNEPGVQFYTGNFLDGSAVGKQGKTYVFRGAFCLETQHFPDSPNQENFPSTLLKPGETYESVCVYRFLTE